MEDGSDGTGFLQRARKSGVALGLLKTFSKISRQVRQVSPGRSLNSGAQVESPVAPVVPGALAQFDNMAPKYPAYPGSDFGTLRIVIDTFRIGDIWACVWL